MRKEICKTYNRVHFIRGGRPSIQPNRCDNINPVLKASAKVEYGINTTCVYGTRVHFHRFRLVLDHALATHVDEINLQNRIDVSSLDEA
jgi:hypothetical protein